MIMAALWRAPPHRAYKIIHKLHFPIPPSQGAYLRPGETRNAFAEMQTNGMIEFSRFVSLHRTHSGRQGESGIRWGSWQGVCSRHIIKVGMLGQGGGVGGAGIIVR